VERKILGRIYGEEHRELLAQIGLGDLQNAINFLGPTDNLARLIPDLSAISPDDAYSIVPYEKGHAFLYYLEKLVGGPAVFDVYLRAHIQHFSGQAITTQDWKDFLFEHFTATENEARLRQVDFGAWLHQSGMPHVRIDHDQTLIRAVLDSVQQWKNGSKDQHNTWFSFSAHQKSTENI